MAAFQLVLSGWGQPELPGWGSVVDNTETKGPIDPMHHVWTECAPLPPMLLVLYKGPLHGLSVVALRPFVYGVGGTF